jgi:nitrogen fixation/metabolism regulation signal transduction histidine kinase
MSIRFKLLSSFLFVTLLILVLFAVRQFYSIKEKDLVREMVIDHEISAQLSALSSAAQKIRRYEKEYFIYVDNPAKRRKYAREFVEAAREINLYLSRLNSIYSTSGKTQALASLKQWKEATRFYTAGFASLNKQVLNGQIKGVIEANAGIQEYKNRFRIVLSGSAKAIDEQYTQAKQKADQIKEYQHSVSLIFMTIALLSLFVSLMMSFQVPAGIVKPLQRLTDVANSISKGRFDDALDVTGSREIQELARSINRLQSATLGLLRRVQNQRKPAVQGQAGGGSEAA